jgi:hypothetical protein
VNAIPLVHQFAAPVVAPGTKARPGDLVNVCACEHIADWHYQVNPATGLMLFALPDGTAARCPNPYCGCERIDRDHVRPLARIPTPNVPCRAQRC